MEYRLIKFRDKIIKRTWEEDKGNLDMKDMAQIFSNGKKGSEMPLPSMYRIIKNENKKNEESNK